MRDKLYFFCDKYIMHKCLERVEVSFLVFKTEKQTGCRTERRMVAEYVSVVILKQ